MVWMKITVDSVKNLVNDWIYYPDDFEDTYGDSYQGMTEIIKQYLAKDTKMSYSDKQACLDELAYGARF